MRKGLSMGVTVKPFFMSQYPVTQAQWTAVTDLPKAELEKDLNPEPSRFPGDNRPVERVSWYEAVEFCARLSKHTGRTYRLPTEAEWEYACRADTTTPYYFGPTITGEWANHNGNIGETTPVGQFPPNAFGLYDMHGNMWEWCEDHWHQNYGVDGGAPTDGSAWLKQDSGASRVLRGGSWDNLPRTCRSACRYDYDPGFRYYSIGFRVVCEARGL